MEYHLFSIIQSNTNLGTSLEGFWTCNKGAKSVDIKIDYLDGSKLTMWAFKKEEIFSYLLVEEKIRDLKYKENFR